METIMVVSTAVLAAVAAALVAYVVRAGRRTAPAVDVGSVVGDLTGQLASERGALEARLDMLGRSVSDIQTALDRREGVIGERMDTIGEQMRGVASLFTSDRQRGSWGELSLTRIFEIVGLVEGRDFRSQFTDGDRRPDVVITLSGERRIVIDSKFPVARYQEAMDIEDPDQRNARLGEHGRELERVGKELVKKHYGQGATGGYVVVYVPSQAVYEAALDAYPELVERLMAGGVIVAGPAAIFALLKTVGTLLAEHRAIAEARALVEDVREVRDRFQTFVGHLGKVGKGLGNAVAAFNGAVGSWSRNLDPILDRIADKAGVDAVDPLVEIEEELRHLPNLEVAS